MAGLHIKYRPRKLSQVVGNETTLRSLQALLKRKEDIPHSFLFTGPSGCGKTTLARIMARKLGCATQSDLQELNTADFRGIDTVRDLLRSMSMLPMNGDVRVFILDEVHSLTKDAQNALLKALEDTPSHVYFMLATTDPEKLLPTIRTRCQQFVVKALTEEELTGLIMTVLLQEKKKVSVEACQQIVQDSLGSARMALVLLDRVVDLPEEEQKTAAEQAASEKNEAIKLCQALIQGAKWSVIAPIVKGLDQDPEQIRRNVIGYCQAVLLGGRDNPRAFLVLDSFSRPFYDNGKPGLTLASYEASHG